MTESGPQLPVLLEALLQPGAYAHPVDGVELIETHISYVLLAGAYAYKIKKPVDLGFLDFSTLAKRQFYCGEEVRLNRRLAPDIYLDVVAIGGTLDAPLLDAEPAIEYAVRMRRFPQAAQLDRMLAAGELEASHLDAFARLIADFHAAAECAPADSPYGGEAAVYAPVEENFRALRAALKTADCQSLLDALESWSMNRFLAHRDLLARRKQAGRVRECHGDLHLRNLAWVDGQPLAFDCIEFAPALRWIDVISEVAFLVMDLQARDQRGLAARFLNGYLERGGDYGGIALLPFYQAYRACVRAKVDAIRLGQDDVSRDDYPGIQQECRRYLELARRYGQQHSPGLIITRGPSGSGKTTWSEQLVEHLGAVRIRSDVERKRLFGLRAEDSGAAPPGEGIYSSAASKATYEKLLDLCAGPLDAGLPVIVDAVFAHEEQRRPFRQLAAHRGIPFVILDFQVGPGVLKERLAARRPDASDADLAVLERQLATWQPLAADEEAVQLAVDATQPVAADELAVRITRALTRD